MRVSVVMNTYNRAYLLKYALASYLRQTEGEFEILVADDGSTDETADVVRAFAAEAPFPVAHIRHDHRGPRRAAILNRGIEAATGDLILFTDCDSLARADLVATHRRHARPDRLLVGGYYRLDEAQTQALTMEAVRAGSFETLPNLRQRLRAYKKHLEAAWQIFWKTPNRPHNMGLNYSAPRDALVRINGYDEAFTGWGSADGDVRERLRATGVTPYSLYDRAFIVHMWHPVQATKPEDKKRNLAYARRGGRETVCRNGIRRLAEGEALPQAR